MRIGPRLILASAVSVSAISTAWPQEPMATRPPAAHVAAPPAATATAPSPASASTSASTASAPAPRPVKAACANPNAIGVSRVIAIDTTGGPGFGFEHFKQLDFLRDKEVVLTFDDGPWPVNTPSVLKTLDEECTKAIFFPVGKHATYYPEDSQTGRRARPHDRRAHLVARQSQQQETRRTTSARKKSRRASAP